MNNLVSNLTSELEDIENEYKDLTMCYEKGNEDLDEVNLELANANLKLSSSNIRNINKKLKRRDDVIAKMSKETSSLQSTLKASQCALHKSEENESFLNEKINHEKRKA